VERIEDAVAVAAGLVRRALQTAGAGLIRFAEARASEDPRSALTPA
jgi:preprotein translocase subunit Sec61beta